jgi:hypothetical protein
MTTHDFQILDDSFLSTTTGGDFASNYVNNLKGDAKAWWNREKAGAVDLQAHNYGGAAKNYGGALLDEVGAIGDAIAPVRALV